MDTVDLLTMAVDVARMVRSVGDPDTLLRAACQHIGCTSTLGDAPLSVRVVRLLEEAGERRPALREFLRARQGPLYLNRPLSEWELQPKSNDQKVPEIQSLTEFLDSEEGQATGIDLFGDRAMPYKVGSREAVHYIKFEGVEQPSQARGLIDYPLGKPVLFSITLGEHGWYLWDILTAFSDQYAKIYENPGQYEIWGHDLDDLWIEQLHYYPSKKLIHPLVGS